MKLFKDGFSVAVALTLITFIALGIRSYLDRNLTNLEIKENINKKYGEITELKKELKERNKHISVETFSSKDCNYIDEKYGIKNVEAAEECFMEFKVKINRNKIKEETNEKTNTNHYESVALK